MKAIIRLNKCHDMDLIILKMEYHVNLAETAKICMRAYVHHENIVFRPCKSPTVPKKYIYKKYQMKQGAEQIQFPSQTFTLTLSEDSDADCIAFWKNIIPGYRTMFIKQLLRIYLKTPMIPEFLCHVPKDLNKYTDTPTDTYDIPLRDKNRLKSRTREEIESHILKNDLQLSTGNDTERQKIEEDILRTNPVYQPPHSSVKREKTIGSGAIVPVSSVDKDIRDNHGRKYGYDGQRIPFNDKNETIELNKSSDADLKEDDDELMNLLSAWTNG